MSELNTPDTYIEDPLVAVEVAYSAKDIRSEAAAIRLVDSLAEEAKTLEPRDYKGKAEYTEKLMGAYAIYPEVFIKAFGGPNKDRDSLSEHELTDAIAKITKRGFLPLGEWGGKAEVSDIDKKADVIETVAEALIVHPPSQDFLRDNKLGREQYLGTRQKGYRWVISIEDVVEQLDGWKALDKNIHETEYDVNRILEKYGRLNTELPDNTNTKLSLILSSFDRVEVYTYVDGHKEMEKEFTDKVRAAKNSDTTTIADLRDLYVVGADAALELMRSTRDKHLAVYEAIVSGNAARYKSPNPSEKQS